MPTLSSPHTPARRLSIWLMSLTAMAWTAVSTFAAEPTAVKLWPGAVPHQSTDTKREIVSEMHPKIGTKVTLVTEPTLTIYPAPEDRNTGTAVVIAPGGGYNILAYDLEGVEVARWLNDIGVTALVLHYRVPRSKTLEKHEVALVDAQRAMRVARQHASEWGYRPDRIGMLGFSAGGHLTAMTGTSFHQKTYYGVDMADEISPRPDFLILIYPAYLLVDEKTLTLSPEVQVPSDAPPAFLVHAGDDPHTALGSLALYKAFKSAGLSAELHIYPDGGHGYGLRPTRFTVTSWPDRAEAWMGSQGLLHSAEDNGT